MGARKQLGKVPKILWWEKRGVIARIHPICYRKRETPWWRFSVHLLCLQIGKLLFLIAFCANTATSLIPSLNTIPSVRGEPA